MANPEHLKLLKQGVEVWNAWRGEYPKAILDLRGANLSEANLGGADLDHAYLRDADLRGANLWETNLSTTVALINSAIKIQTQAKKASSQSSF